MTSDVVQKVLQGLARDNGWEVSEARPMFADHYGWSATKGSRSLLIMHANHGPVLQVIETDYGDSRKEITPRDLADILGEELAVTEALELPRGS